MSLFGGPPDVAKLKERRDVNGLIKALRFRRSPPPGYNPIKTIYTVARSGGGILNVGFDDGYEVRNKALEALVAIGSEAVPPLIKALDDRTEDIRLNASKALVQLMDKRAVDPLFLMLDDPVIGENAIAILAHFGDTRAIKPLLHRIGKAEISSNQDPNNAGAYGNDQLKMLSLLEPFSTSWPPIGLRCLSDMDLPLRIGAAVAFGYANAGSRSWPGSGGPEVAQALLKALDDPDLVMRESSARALVSVVRPTLGPNIAEALSSKLDNFGQHWTAQAAGYLAKALAIVGGPENHACILSVAIELAYSRDAYHREYSVEILDLVKSPDATRLLKKLSTKDDWIGVRMRAEEALKKR